MKAKTYSEDDIGQTLGIDPSPGRMKHRKRWFLVGLVLVIGAVTSVIVWTRAETSNSVQYRVQEAQRGDLTVTVTATGVVEPTNQVDVSSELSGIMKTVAVDYNDRVKVGQVLARLDTDKLEAQVLQSKAALESAQSRVLEAQATVMETEKGLARLKRVRELSGDKVPSQHDLDAAQAAVERAQAAETTARAQVSEAGATLEGKETDLRKAVIYSPINGIVLTRNVEPGQTVAASFQAPVLFTLAEDLTQMELHVDVDEADVGRVREEQEAVFTVDAYQDRHFPARVRQVRYGSETVNGVVTYKTVLNVGNSDLSLRPGMTATADITVEKIENAILVPNAALRFAPPVTEKETPSDPRSLLSKLLPGPPRRSARQGKDGPAGNKQQRVWTLQDGKLVPIAVTTGASDGTLTEVTGSDIAPGMGLVVDTVKSGP